MARGRKKQSKTGGKQVKGQGQTKSPVKRKRDEAVEEEKTNEEEAKKSDVKKQKRDDDTKKPSSKKHSPKKPSSKKHSSKKHSSKKHSSEKPSSKKPSSKKPSSKLKCSVNWSVKTKFHTYTMNFLATGEYLTLSGRERSRKKDWTMIKYDLQGNQLDRAIFEFPPSGMTEVFLGKKHCVAVTSGLLTVSGKIRKIDFYDLENLDNLLLCYKVPEHFPGSVCVGPPGVLLYVDEDPYVNQENSLVRWLDCSTSPPKPRKPVNTTVLPKAGELCYVQHEGQNLIITVSLDVSAYEAETGKLVWRVNGQSPGMEREFYPYLITTDGRGHLFVSDTRNIPVHEERIHVFSTSGEHMGTVLDEEEFGEIGSIKWCEEISSLIVVHKKEDTKDLRLSAFKIQ